MIPQILTSTRNIFSRFSFSGPGKGNQALVTIKDLQTVINNINNQIRYRPYEFMLTAMPNNANPTIKTLVYGVSDGECSGSCNCSGNTCPCFDSVNLSCSNEAFTLMVAPTRVGVGTFHLNFSPNHPDLVNRGIGIWVAALPSKDDQVIVSPIVNNVITITTYRNGVLEDLVLRDTAFSMKLYVNNK